MWFQLGWKLDFCTFPTITVNPLIHPDKRERHLKLGLESSSKVQKQKRHSFLKSYGFHSLQGVLNVIRNLCGSLWLTYFTIIPYQTKKINWQKINSYFYNASDFCSPRIFQPLFLLSIFHYHIQQMLKNNLRLLFYLFMILF